jgi:dTMP kinase
VIVSFEGVNFSGKTTQAAMLCNALAACGAAVRGFAFPSYDTPIGMLLQAALDRRVFIDGEPLFALFAANRLEHLPQISEAIERHEVIVCDRYSESEYAYGASRGADIRWLTAIESRMPRSELVVLLDINYAVARRRSSEGSHFDIFESDARYLERVRSVYLDIAHTDALERWLIIDASKAPDEIHAEVLARVTAIMGALE